MSDGKILSSAITKAALTRSLRKDPDSGIGTNKEETAKQKETDKQPSHSWF
jgi:hypothetical protein